MLADISNVDAIYIVCGLSSGYFYHHHSKNPHNFGGSVIKDDDKNVAYLLIL